MAVFNEHFALNLIVIHLAVHHTVISGNDSVELSSGFTSTSLTCVRGWDFHQNAIQTVAIIISYLD